MNMQDKFLRNGFALFSLLTSFLFVYYAVSVLVGSSAGFNLKLFAYVAGGYGLLNTYILSFAWRSGASWTPLANLCVAGCFFGVLLMDSLRNGLVGAQAGGLLGLAAVLGINWYALKVLCRA